ncbi:hypothetical protein [Candidatus Nitrospira bockiana]
MDQSDLLNDLGRLTRNIQKALTTLSESKEPMNASAAQLPLAKQYLADLKRMTEEGTHVVMDVTEALQEAQGRIREAVRAHPGDRAVQTIEDVLRENETRFVQIFTALSFQDLVAQRIAALCRLLDDVEAKLRTVIDLFGVQATGTDALDDSEAGAVLKRLASARSALSQLVVDEVFTEYKYSSDRDG